MRIWIDATSPASCLSIFGMTLLERLLQNLLTAGLNEFAVHIQLAEETRSQSSIIPPKLLQKFRIQWECESLAPHLPHSEGNPIGHNELVLAFDAATVIDGRLVRHLAETEGSWAVRCQNHMGNIGAFRLEAGLSSRLTSTATSSSFSQTAGEWMRQGHLNELELEKIPSYIRKLRRDLPIYLYSVPDSPTRNWTERFLFWSNYKGSTDFFTKYVYPPVVWQLVRPLSRWGVHPNTISVFNVLITFLAVPAFATGNWALGFLLAYTMSILDSVDGKLARLTFTASRLGDILDHGLDIIHPPFWYFAWAWALTTGDTSAILFKLAVCMTIFYTADRVVAGLFSSRTGSSIHGCSSLDERMRTFISRRNINVPLFMVGLLLGVPGPTFTFIVIWQIISFVFHAVRLVNFWNKAPAIHKIPG